MFSLAAINEIDDDGVTFRSHIDGSKHRLDARGLDAHPERCSAPTSRCASTSARRATRPPRSRRSRSRARPRGRSAAARRRARRVRRCSASCRAASTPRAGCATWPRSPRSTSTATRSAASRSARASTRPTAILDEVAHPLPAERPRYLMGVGTPADLERGIARRHRHVRLRDADPQRAQRLPVHRRAAGSTSRTRRTAPISARSTRVPVLDLPRPTRARTCDISTSPKRSSTRASQPCTTSRSTRATSAGCASGSSPRACRA